MFKIFWELFSNASVFKYSMFLFCKCVSQNKARYAHSQVKYLVLKEAFCTQEEIDRSTG